MATTAATLAAWAADYVPTAQDLELADRSLVDTLAVAIAGRDEPTVRRAAWLSEAGLWAVAAHVLDFDDLHMESTTHISAVCLPAALAVGGDARAYLAGAGVMARLGVGLGWPHYTSGWHATCTAGAPAAAVAAGVAMGLDVPELATAITLAVPGAGGVRRAFGTDAKSLQVGFAVETGIRAAALAAAGATGDVATLDQWMALVGGDPKRVNVDGPAVPGGLAIKLFPCCYAMQRPIGSLVEVKDSIDVGAIEKIVVRTPRETVTPLIHHNPTTGLEGKFSLEYAVAVALLDKHPGFSSFSDAAVNRPEASSLIRRTHLELLDGAGDGLLDGEFEAEIHIGGEIHRLRQKLPLGSPSRPPGPEEFGRKVEDCLTGTGLTAEDLDWPTARETFRSVLPHHHPVSALSGVVS